MYIVIEGQDGTGKSTQVNLLKEHFESLGKTVIIMEEPTGDLPQAKDLHDILLTKGYDLAPMTNVLLFTAARMELWQKLALPVLKSDGVVISARNWWSTLAYQGYGEGISRSKIIRLTKEVLPDAYVNPSSGFILAAPDTVRLARQKNRGKPTETFEARPDAFQAKVDAGYLKIAKSLNIPLIDASGTIEEIFMQIKSRLN